ncbi:hypothetical protein RF11_02768 [Thelohanellus kitauei]|uniref:Uncharacterized protein n=1 Tax=Thelohanellus kitauei TaxID=669202 RepID=A0A0C2J8D1_THEKT|nr:hypothetical protein RF11_02768 [Thelohanellus kitauei]
MVILDYVEYVDRLYEIRVEILLRKYGSCSFSHVKVFRMVEQITMAVDVANDPTTFETLSATVIRFHISTQNLLFFALLHFKDQKIGLLAIGVLKQSISGTFLTGFQSNPRLKTAQSQTQVQIESTCNMNNGTQLQPNEEET